MEKDKAFILDSLIFAERILEFTSEMDEEMFANELKTLFLHKNPKLK